MMQDYHFSIRGDLELNGQTVNLYPENFVNVIRSSRYHDNMFPIMLARLQIDKNLFDHIIKNADSILIHIVITKFMMSEDRQRRSAEETYIDDYFQVTIGSDVNYNKELDYIEESVKGIKVEDKFKETYIGLVSKSCIDANKIVANDVILESMMQDLILGYFDQKGLHVLFEPLHNNEEIKQLSLPPIDSLYTLLEHLNGMKVFYNTNYLFFIDEPYVTYFISKAGKGIPMVGEKSNNVIIRMNSSLDNFNMGVGMNNDGMTDAYIVEASVHESNYSIDNDTVKMINTIEAVINPSIDHTKIAEDTFKNMKNEIMNQMHTFLDSVLQRVLSEPNLGCLSSVATMFMEQATATIKEATAEFQTLIKSGVFDVINSIPNSISGKRQGEDEGSGDGEIVSIPIISERNRSIILNFTNNQFVQGQVNAELQEQITNAIGPKLFESCEQAYIQDFVDNFIGAVSYVNAKDVSKATTDIMNQIGEAIPSLLEGMATEVTSKMGSFEGLLGNINGVNSAVDEIKEILKSAQDAIDNAGITVDIDIPGMIEKCEGLQEKLDEMAEDSVEPIETAHKSHNQALKINDNVQAFANIIGNLHGCFDGINQTDVKDRLSTNEPPRIFGDLNPALFQIGGCFGGGSSGSSSDAFTGGSILEAISNIDLESLVNNVIGGVINFEDISKLKDNLEKFDLTNLGNLGLSSIGFDLNIGSCFPDLGTGGRLNKTIGPTGVRIIKVKNDNPNELKCIKAEFELGKNTFSVNKMGLDPSVFTPNKRYFIQNYSSHDNKDGQFILNDRVEVFVREDDTFVCTTQLTFSKLPDENMKADSTGYGAQSMSDSASQTSNSDEAVAASLL